MSIFKWESKTGDYKVLQRDKRDKRLSMIIYFSNNEWTAQLTLLRKIRGSIMWQISPVRKDGSEKTGYATQKPKEIPERIIKASSNEGDLVADFYCGSGTSLVVAKELSRNYIGCDINQRAVDITEERLNK